MKLTEIYIKGFRNLQNIEFKAAEKLNAFFGENAQGKTNFLEALYVALRGDSFRYYSQKKDWLPARGNIEVKTTLYSALGTRHQIEMKSEEKGIRYFLDEKRIPLVILKKKHPIVVFSPDDHTLVRGDPQVRRQFGEDVMSDGVPGFAEVQSEYEKALKNRNALLKQCREFGLSREIRTQILHWDLILAKFAMKILELRAEAWPNYTNTFQRVIGEIFHTKNVNMSWKTFEGEKTLESYVENLGKSLEKDIATGWSHFGIHRDDIEILVNQMSARNTASQGQARMLAMALRWSHAEWIKERNLEEPLFFVDDFSSELDEKHREALLKRLLQSEGQVFLTGTNESFLGSNLLANSTKSYIVNGRILEREISG
jgi:DNA replication and repair protein RecF